MQTVKILCKKLSNKIIAYNDDKNITQQTRTTSRIQQLYLYSLCSETGSAATHRDHRVRLITDSY